VTKAHDDSVPESLANLIERARSAQATDVHVDAAQGVAFRVASCIRRISRAAPAHEDIQRFVEVALERLPRARLDKLGIADTLYADDRVGALRVHVSRGLRGYRLAIRLLVRAVPDLSTLRLPAIVASFGEYRYGLILLCGPSGSGKTTTAASLLQRANESSARHVVTFEAPIEHVLTWGTSVVTQYEVGRDVATYAHGIRGALRADPDIIFIGELSDDDAAAACLQAAESGHLVLGALDAPPDVPLALNRFIGLFPVDEQQRARNRLSDNLRAVLALRLVPASDGSGLRAAAEILLSNDAVRRMVRDGALHTLRSVLAANKKAGMQTLEMSLGDLVSAGDVDLEIARSIALYPEEIRP